MGNFLLVPHTVANKSNWARGVFPPGVPSDAYVLGAVQSGTPGANVIDVPFNQDGQLQLDFDSTLSIFLDGSGTPTSLASLPGGFTVTAAAVHSFLAFASGATPSLLDMYLSFDPLTISGLLHPISTGSDVPFVWPGLGLPTMLDLVNGGVGVRAIGDGVAYGVILQTVSNGALFISGTYTTVSTAWVIPDPATSPDGVGPAGTGVPESLNSDNVRNSCGVGTESHVVIAGSSPGADYVALVAPPTPLIDSVTPPAGTKYGGEPVTIRGSAFSDAASVTFDGVSATSVVVVSQFEITCLTPAHAVGAIDVVVTNADGTHS